MKRRQILKAGGAFALTSTMIGSAAADTTEIGGLRENSDIVLVNNSPAQKKILLTLGTGLGQQNRGRFEWEVPGIPEESHEKNSKIREETNNIITISLTESPTRNAVIHAKSGDAEETARFPFRSSGLPDTFHGYIEVTRQGDIDIQRMVD